MLSFLLDMGTLQVRRLEFSSREEMLRKIEEKRDRELARCDKISDGGDPVGAGRLRTTVLMTFSTELEYILGNFNRDGSPKEGPSWPN